MNTSKRSVVIKVGVYSHKGGNHSLVEVVNAICNTFRNAPHIFLTESDNYQGTGTERLNQITIKGQVQKGSTFGRSSSVSRLYHSTCQMILIHKR